METAYHDDGDLPYVTFEPVVNDAVPDWWNSDPVRNTWIDGYTARKTVFPDGQMEITVTRDKHFIGPALIRKPRAKRGESENRERNEATAARAARKRVRQACKTIKADRLITLTYRENMQCRETALKHWKEFTRRMRKHRDFLYVCVLEPQGRGAIHFHVAVHGKVVYQLVRSIWQSILGKGPDGQQMGQVNVRNPNAFGFGKDGAHRLASYLAKYMGKDMSIRELDDKRYFASRGIPKPEIIYWRLGSTDMLSAVNVAVSIAMEGNINGCQIWCNNALGAVWIATAPGRCSESSVPF